MLKFILVEHKQDFEKSGYFKVDYDKVNIEFPINGIISFSFPAGLQSLDFFIQKISYQKNTGNYVFTDILQLDNTHKKTGYFEAYEYVTPLSKGIYRIAVKDTGIIRNITANLIDVRDELVPINNIETITDISNSPLVDTTGDPLTQNS